MPCSDGVAVNLAMVEVVWVVVVDIFCLCSSGIIYGFSGCLGVVGCCGCSGW